ncbi:YbaB/EbfC family nucleoid-associated protein [Nonomuraea zeae]|uniref:YbaB/EbfC family nucleoid-associated protein n=1 Tax=Nonomuraea zeae TaxID=1642303 RepID=A0A5S4GTZ9_9ACTN|nr:YbaB/EbfC family nucleoid-associated protein [Nonomuraea zeae]TMR35981.1 YbaB/EbfC family nucleoid-associated protein [Nonomuraea zeae]
MQEFGDFANIDIDRLLKGAGEQFALMEEFQKKLDSYVGRAQDEHGLVTVEYGQEGVRELDLHPKALRLSSGELADLIKAALKDAARDFQQQIHEAMSATFGDSGDNPMKYLDDPEAAGREIKEAQSAYDRTFDDVMGELNRIRLRMEL